MERTLSRALSVVFVLAICPSCGLQSHFVPNGPLGAPNPENIKIHYEEPLLSRPGGGNLASRAPQPEYGGSPAWRYVGPDITGMPEGAPVLQGTRGLPAGVQGAQPIPVQPTAPPLNFSRLNYLINTAAGISSFISALGVKGAPDVLTCTSSPALKELMACVQSRAARKLRSPGNCGAEYASHVWWPVSMDLDLPCTSMSDFRDYDDVHVCRCWLISMWHSRIFEVSRMLMQKELTPDRQRWQAGSIVTTVTDLPVASDINDTKSGGFGHVNVILPRPSRVHRGDKIIAQLSKGIDPADTLYGGLGVEGRTDVRFPLSSP